MILEYHFSFDVLGKCALAAGLRAWAREEAQIKTRVKSFRITDAECCYDDDRVLVERNIHMFAAHFGFVQEESTTEEALARFNELVHTEVPRVLKSSFGRVGIPLEYTWAIFLPLTLQHIDRILCSVAAGDSLHDIFVAMVRYLVCFLALDPITVAVCFWASKVSLKLWNIIGTALTGVLTSVISYFLWLGFFELSRKAEKSRPMLVLYCVTCSAMLLFTGLIYMPQKQTQSQFRFEQLPSEYHRA